MPPQSTLPKPPRRAAKYVRKESSTPLRSVPATFLTYFDPLAAPLRHRKIYPANQNHQCLWQLRHPPLYSTLPGVLSI